MDDLIRFSCGSCNKSLRAPQSAAGRPGKCPGCGSSFTVPDDLIQIDEEDNQYAPFAPQDTKYCHHCARPIAKFAEICPGCGVRQPSLSRRNSNEESAKGLIPAGYICAGLALIIIPPFLGLAGAVIGVINLTKNRIGHGIGQIFASVICGIVGMIFGVMIGQAVGQ